DPSVAAGFEAQTLLGRENLFGWFLDRISTFKPVLGKLRRAGRIWPAEGWYSTQLRFDVNDCIHFIWTFNDRHFNARWRSSLKLQSTGSKGETIRKPAVALTQVTSLQHPPRPW
uniref:Uncharacterized protein n=1 Tax=Hippocampus comes TaxID=109280 RepID=A0A3Q2Z0N2_HIPCM